MQRNWRVPFIVLQPYNFLKIIYQGLFNCVTVGKLFLTFGYYE